MMKVGIVTVSDRASRGEYEDRGGPAIEGYLRRVVCSSWTPVRRVIPDGRQSVAETLRVLCDQEHAGLILVTGGTGPAVRDETPEGLFDVLEKELPGFGEVMRRQSLDHVPTAILSRQTAGIRGQSLIILLPGRPASIEICLDAVFAAVPYCLELIGAGGLAIKSDQPQDFPARQLALVTGS